MHYQVIAEQDLLARAEIFPSALDNNAVTPRLHTRRRSRELDSLQLKRNGLR